jgi:glycosyltransferase involved in cell wall biosynthesis
MARTPDIAVIIGAYRREPYLLSAVRSVLAQSVGPDRFEIVVTKNFHHAEIDGFLAGHGIPNLFDDDPRIGTWLLRAVAATKAPLLAFLDDDDEFEPDRLERVLGIFAAHPDLAFYRNRVSVIDGNGARVPTSSWKPKETGPLLDQIGATYWSADRKREVAGLVREHRGLTFNSSTMVVARSVLEGVFRDAFARTQLPDLALFVLGELGPGGLFLDDRRTTRFRSYGANVTLNVEWLRHAAESHRDLGAVARSNGSPEIAAWLDELADHYGRLYRGGRVVADIRARTPRRGVLQDTAEYLRLLGRVPRERRLTLDVWATVAYGGVYAVSPGTARRLLRANLTRRD